MQVTARVETALTLTTPLDGVHVDALALLGLLARIRADMPVAVSNDSVARALVSLGVLVEPSPVLALQTPGPQFDAYLDGLQAALAGHAAEVAALGYRPGASIGYHGPDQTMPCMEAGYCI